MSPLEILSQSCQTLQLPLERKCGVYLLILGDGVVYVYTYSAKTCRGLGFRPLSYLTPATAQEAV